MAVCRNCGTDSPDTFKFCPSCATPLDQAPQPQAEERKVVSVLFVDLVGFTSRSHDADPEDVRAALVPYHRLLKTEIEPFGGTVEKFIGDAVMAVFGAPVAHEDDAERAIRAALRITDAITDLNETIPGPHLSVRVAVHTGEGLVSTSARVEEGEGMVTGDVVNTASRLQQLAPVNGVVVGEATYRSTKDSIKYEELGAVAVKGKPEPLPVWRAVSAHGRSGVDITTRYRTPFIGREFDLATLRTLLQRTLQESSLQLIAVVGEPGVGKSRLLAEFSSYIDQLPELITWRQGRSLPYGDGITFWALGELVKAHAGIKESDPPEVASAKLAAATAGVEGDKSERAWLHSRLAPLVGVPSPGGGADQEESFTAWLRFFEAAAATRPLILAFEDLHWADESLLAFIEHVVEWSTGVPILVVCTARPDLFQRHPSWATRSRNATTISLSPLRDAEIAQLVSGLLTHSVLSADMQAALLERAGGNPLFAEEFVRMLAERGLLLQKGGTVALAPRSEVPMPDSIQAIIAARLDSLPYERKSLLHNAAVVGRVFWSGAVAEIDGLDEGAVRRSLQELVHAELVRPARMSSIEGQQEYAFWHALVRDVAYGQMPRPQRAAKHLAAAQWIEGIAGERVADHAEILAHHYEEATKLLIASGMSEQAAELVEPTIRLLVLAGDRALDLDVERAQEHYEKGWRLISAEDPGRPAMLLKLGKATFSAGRIEEANNHFVHALELFHAAGDQRGEADAGLWLAGISWEAGLRRERSRYLVSRSIMLLEKMEPGRELAVAYWMLANDTLLSGVPAEALVSADKARRIAEQVGDLRMALEARTSYASALCELGNIEGLGQLRKAYEESVTSGWGEEMAFTCSALSCRLWLTEGPAEGLRVYREGIERSEQRGLIGAGMFCRAETVWMLYDLGRWEELLETARLIVRESRKHKLGASEATVLPYMAQVLAWRQLTEAHDLCEEVLLLARQMEILQTLTPSLVIAALVAQMRVQSETAVALIEELARVTDHSAPYRSRHLPTALRILVAAGEVDKAISFAHDLEVTATRDRYCVLTGRAILAEARAHFEEARELYEKAASRWADYGFVLEEGQALLGFARCLIALGDREATTEPLRKARAIFARLGTQPLKEEVDRYLPGASALSS